MRSSLVEFESGVRRSHPRFHRTLQVAAIAFFLALLGITIAFASQPLQALWIGNLGALLVLVGIVLGGASVGVGLILAVAAILREVKRG